MAIGSIAFGGTSAGLTKGQADSSYASLSQPVAPGFKVTNPRGLRRFTNNALGNAINGRGPIVALGDSTVFGVGADGINAVNNLPDAASGWPATLRTLLASQYGDPGEGLLLANASAGNAQDTRVTTTGVASASTGPLHASTKLVSGQTLTVTTDDATLTCLGLILWGSSGNLLPTYTVDGGGTQTLGSAPVANDIYVEYSIPLTAGTTHTVIVSGPATTQAYVGGVVKRKGTAPSGRSVSDAVTTNTSQTLTSATAAFTSTDQNRPVWGNGIPAGTTILAVNSATSVTLSQAATITASGVTIVLGPSTKGIPVHRMGITGYTSSDPLGGEVSGALTLSSPQQDRALRSCFQWEVPGLIIWSFGANDWKYQKNTFTVTDGTLTNGSPTLVCATAHFDQSDAGKTITGTGIPGGTTVGGVSLDGKTATLTANATATGTPTLTVTSSVSQSGVTPALFGAWAQQFITTAVANGWCVLLLGQPSAWDDSYSATQAQPTYSEQSYRDQLKTIAQTTDHVAYADIRDLFGTFTTGHANGLQIPNSVHCYPRGYGAIGRALYQLLTLPFGENAPVT